MSILNDLKNPGKYFRMISKLGEGSYGSVFKAVHIKSKVKVAVKMIELNENDLKTIADELKVLVQFSTHETIASYFGTYASPGDRKNKVRLWIIMELCSGGSLMDMITIFIRPEKKCLPINWILYVVKRVLDGLNYLHEHGVIHRDIKSQNILLNYDAQIKLVDFGVSALKNETKTFIGTPYWIAPEVIQCEKNSAITYNNKCDIWSLGITCFEMAQGKTPYHGLAPVKAMAIISKGQTPKLSNSYYHQKTFIKLLNSMLLKNPDNRLSCQELIELEVFRNYSDNTDYETYNKILEYVQTRYPDEICKTITKKKGSHLILRENIKNEIGEQDKMIIKYFYEENDFESIKSESTNSFDDDNNDEYQIKTVGLGEELNLPKLEDLTILSNCSSSSSKVNGDEKLEIRNIQVNPPKKSTSSHIKDMDRASTPNKQEHHNNSIDAKLRSKQKLDLLFKSCEKSDIMESSIMNTDESINMIMKKRPSEFKPKSKSTSAMKHRYASVNPNNIGNYERKLLGNKGTTSSKYQTKKQRHSTILTNRIEPNVITSSDKTLNRVSKVTLLKTLKQFKKKWSFNFRNKIYGATAYDEQIILATSNGAYLWNVVDNGIVKLINKHKIRKIILYEDFDAVVTICGRNHELESYIFSQLLYNAEEINEEMVELVVDSFNNPNNLCDFGHCIYRDKLHVAYVHNKNIYIFNKPKRSDVFALISVISIVNKSVQHIILVSSMDKLFVAYSDNDRIQVKIVDLIDHQCIDYTTIDSPDNFGSRIANIQIITNDSRDNIYVLFKGVTKYTLIKFDIEQKSTSRTFIVWKHNISETVILDDGRIIGFFKQGYEMKESSGDTIAIEYYKKAQLHFLLKNKSDIYLWNKKDAYGEIWTL